MDAIEEATAVALKLLESGRAVEAEQLCRLAVREQPGSAQAWFLLGTALQLQGKPGQAISPYEHAIAIDPARLEALNNLGAALCAIGRVDDSARRLEQAIAALPEYAEAHNNLGNARQRQGRFADAIECYRRALELRPRYLDAHNNLGNALRSAGRPDLAVESYDRALELAPEHPRVRLGRAIAWLQQGDYARGWPEFEWRLKCPEHAVPSLPGPVWDGAQLNGRSILLYADSGLGDAIMYIRYAQDVAARGGRVVVACRRPLARLFEGSPGVARVVAEGEDLPPFAVHAPLMSLPRILGATEPTGPEVVPYLAVDAALVDHYRFELEPMAGLRIGIAWQGSPAYHRDAERSFRLEQFEPLARVPGVRLVSLQKGAGTEQLAELGGRFEVFDFGTGTEDLADAAAVMKNLDLVVAPDTALAHLAGGLGVPAWVALGPATDWRWLLGRDDSPWYPRTRLFRQQRWGDWHGVFERMARELEDQNTPTRIRIDLIADL